jgi:hypothetical protein
MRILRDSSEITFIGWGMTTSSTYPPWHGVASSRTDAIVMALRNAEELILSDSESGKFESKQFSEEDIRYVLENLRWRHYILQSFCTYSFSSRMNQSQQFCFAECGVCDGLSTRFIIEILSEKGMCNWRGFLYDAWDSMRAEDLVGLERRNIGSYDYLDVEVARKNLSVSASSLVFNVGYVPEVFVSANNPSELHFLHIDLNSSRATLAAIEFFSSRLVSGSVVLFDDYGWKDHVETRRVVDDFARLRGAACLQLPTGQGVVLL